jgi:hypothetical protein
MTFNFENKGKKAVIVRTITKKLLEMKNHIISTEPVPVPQEE